MINTFRDGCVDDGRGCGVEFYRLFVITGVDNGVKVFDSGFYFRFIVFIYGIFLFVDEYALFRGFNVGHFIYSFNMFNFKVLYILT